VVTYIKGTMSRDFSPLFFHLLSMSGSRIHPDTVLHIALNSLRQSNLKQIPTEANFFLQARTD
jgi:hypothetical protein